MYDYTQDTDHSLAEFVNDYIEGTLDTSEQVAFEEYVSVEPELRAFVNKSRKGKQALNNAFRVCAADDFEEKLAERIANEKSEQPFRNSADLASA